MIDIELECDDCGADVEYELEYRRHDIRIKVKPCSFCMNSTYAEGESDGYQKAQDEVLSGDD